MQFANDYFDVASGLNEVINLYLRWTRNINAIFACKSHKNQ